jgi:hypothetical protein
VRFTVFDQGTIYRTAAGLQGYYPRGVRLGEREFLASFVASDTIESPDSHPELTRSTDDGATWVAEGPIDPGAVSAGRTTETGFISLAPDGSLLCLGARWGIDPGDPTCPLIHPQTVGMRANEAILRRSADGGRTWTPPVTLPKPYPVPLELPTGVVALADGTLIISCSTWREWDGRCPFGHRVTTMRSTDGGATWSEPIDIFHDPADRVGFWEARIAQLAGEVWSPEDRRTGSITRDDYAVPHFQFGAPSAIRLSDDTFLVVYWCVVSGRAGINWTRCRLE